MEKFEKNDYMFIWNEWKRWVRKRRNNENKVKLCLEWQVLTDSSFEGSHNTKWVFVVSFPTPDSGIQDVKD